jgi:alpha-tubulin suppressor-like RCC1 family protein
MLLTGVLLCCTGDGHVLAIAADGRVWGWGKNDCSQLGLGSCTSWQATPIDIIAALDGAWKVITS